MNPKVAFQEHPALEYTIGLAKSLIRLGVRLKIFGVSHSDPHDIRIYSKSPDTKSKTYPLHHEEKFPDGLKRLTPPRLPHSLNQSLLSLALALGNYDIFHLNGASQAWFVLRAKKLSRTKIVYTNHMAPVSEPIYLKKYKDPLAPFYEEEKRWIPYICKIAVRIVTPSNYAKRLLKEIFDVHSVVIPHGVDLKNFNPSVSGERVRKQLGIENMKLVLWVSRFGQHSYKDPFTFIKAISQVRKSYPKVRFLMIGHGPLYPYAMKMAKELRITGMLQTIPYVNNLNEYFAAADVFTLTSYNDTFGLTLLEAMACGRPAIASNSGAPQEVIGDAGLLFEYGDPHDLADKITSLLNDEELALRLCRKSYERVLNRYTWEKAATKYLKIYHHSIH